MAAPWVGRWLLSAGSVAGSVAGPGTPRAASSSASNSDVSAMVG
jgi:hypothetical protein